MSKKTYEIKAETPLGIMTYDVDAHSMLDASKVFHAQYPAYAIKGVRMRLEGEKRVPPLRRDLD